MGIGRIKGITQKEYDDWLKYCDHVQTVTSHKLHESSSERKARVAHLLKPENYDEAFRYWFAHYCDDGQTGCSKYQIRNAERLHKMRDVVLLQIHHRQHAKSTHGNMGYPLHLMFNDEVWFMLLMGFNEKKAARLLRDLQTELQYNHRIINDFGVQFSHGDWADGSFMTTKGVAFESLSYLQDPAGLRNGQYRPDYASVDDVENRKKAKNKVIVREAVDNILSNLGEAMDKDRRRLVINNNRKAKGGIIDTIVDDIGKKKNTVVSLVNAVGANGKSNWPERYPNKYWKEKKATTTHRVWEREYMNNPIEDGNIIKPEQIRWKMPLSYKDYEALVLYGDMSYTATGDLKSMWLVGKTAREFHVLEGFHRQTTMPNAARWTYDLHEDELRGLDPLYMIEANFIQGMFLNDFDEEGDERGYYLPVRGDKRQKGDKFDRIENNLAPVFERGYIYFNELKRKDPDFITGIDCILAFEKGSGAPDDPPDALESAVFELNKRSMNRVDKIRVIDHSQKFVD